MLPADVVALEIEKVRSEVPDLLEQDEAFWAGVGVRTDVEWISSRDARAPLRLRAGGKSGSFDPAGGDMGRGSGSKYDKAVINVANMKHAIEWTYATELTTDQKRKAVLNAFRKELSDGMDEFRRHIESWCMTDGDGVIGTVSAVALGTGTDGGDILTLNSDGFGAKLIRDNDDVNIYNSALSTNRTAGAERTVVFYDAPNKIVHTTPTLPSLVAGDKIVVSGLTATPPVFLNGVPYHYDSSSSGTWLGLSRSTIPQIRANRVNASGPLALPFPRLAMNKMGDRAGIKNMKGGIKAWCHPCQAAAYEEMAQLITMITKSSGSSSNGGVDLYFGADMQMAGAPLSPSFMWDKTRIDFIIKDIWGRVQQKAPDFYEVDGRTIFPLRGQSGGLAAAKLSYLNAHFGLFIDNPIKATYIDLLDVPAGY